MKKIVNGKRYDTKTAERVARWVNGYNTNDFQWCQEDLYKTAKGNFFIYGQGGAMSAYAESCGNTTCGSEDIRPLTAAETRHWLEEHACANELEELFPDAIEDA